MERAICGGYRQEHCGREGRLAYALRSAMANFRPDLAVTRTAGVQDEGDCLLERQCFGPGPSTYPEANVVPGDIKPHIANGRAQVVFRLFEAAIFFPDW